MYLRHSLQLLLICHGPGVQLKGSWGQYLWNRRRGQYGMPLIKITVAEPFQSQMHLMCTQDFSIILDSISQLVQLCAIKQKQPKASPAEALKWRLEAEGWPAADPGLGGLWSGESVSGQCRSSASGPPEGLSLPLCSSRTGRPMDTGLCAE